MSPDSRTFTARWVFPVAGPPLANGTITVRGTVIESVDPRGVRTPDEDLGNVAILPGLVNPHTHLDLSGARGRIPPTDPDHFTDWLWGVIAYRRARSPEQVQEDIRDGLAECVRYGTTLVGDIAADGASWEVVIQGKTRGVIFWEMIGLSEERARSAIERCKMSWLTGVGTALCRRGLSPHAPYSARVDLFGGGQDDILSSHVAESPGEMELLSNGSGPFVKFLEELGAWDSCSLSPFNRYLTRSRSVGDCIFAHCNYLPPDTPFASNQSIVYCPRTHAAFRHPPHPFREFLKRGVRVCLGTDSLASNPDLDLLAEARFVHAKYPDFPGDTLLKMITLSGAEALGWADEAGSLEAGKSADFVAVPVPDCDAADPHDLLFADHRGERRTLFRGEWRT
jgi:aminodeoxyfutalosine deaminase